MISDRLKKLIFKKLYNDLSKVEIIHYYDSIWFIGREEKKWYFELRKDGVLWWSYDFFNSFFSLFSMVSFEFEPIIKDWVEEVLNHRVSTTSVFEFAQTDKVEEVLNHRVFTTFAGYIPAKKAVEEVLNHRVFTTWPISYIRAFKVEEVLNHRVFTTNHLFSDLVFEVEEVLNHKVI